MRDGPAYAADAFDRRIVTLLAFGPVATVVLLSLVTGRDTVPLWGYPLWLFLGLWIVLNARLLDRVTVSRIAAMWGIVFAVTAVAFVVAYDVLPRFRDRYIAVLYPGDRLGAEMSRRFRAMTGKPLDYVIASMWDGGNISRYAPERPRVLIDGRPGRAPWIDLGDLRAKGALVVWTGGGGPRGLPLEFRAVAEDAEIQPPFALPMRLGKGTVTVNWAVLRPAAGWWRELQRCRRYVSALITLATFSKISPIWLSLTISGGVTAIESPTVRNMMLSSWKPRSIAS